MNWVPLLQSVKLPPHTATAMVKTGQFYAIFRKSEGVTGDLFRTISAGLRTVLVVITPRQLVGINYNDWSSCRALP
jgi:hypothetical protein